MHTGTHPCPFHPRQRRVDRQRFLFHLALPPYTPRQTMKHTIIHRESARWHRCHLCLPSRVLVLFLEFAIARNQLVIAVEGAPCSARAGNR
jgi:hypothetical protein